jgi:hypothetical protein
MVTRGRDLNPSLNADERKELLAALHRAHRACQKTQKTVAVYSDIYDAAVYAMSNLDALAEAVTGERRSLYRRR